MLKNWLAGAVLLLATINFLTYDDGYAVADEASVDVQVLPMVSTPQAAWDGFTSALRQGKMREAYSMLCDDSRRELSYRDFCVRWHPVSARYQDVLQPPGFSEFRISGGVATLRLGLNGDMLREGRMAQAVLVNSGSGWQVLDGPSMHNSLSEAAARSTIKRLVTYSPLVRKALQSGEQVGLSQLREENPRLFEETAVKGFLNDYDITIDSLRDGALIASPKHGRLRGYMVNIEGQISPIDGRSSNRHTGEELARLRKQQRDAVLKKQQELALKRQKELQLAQQRALMKQREMELEKLRQATTMKIQEDLRHDAVVEHYDIDYVGGGISRVNTVDAVPDFGDPDKAPAAKPVVDNMVSDMSVAAVSVTAPQSVNLVKSSELPVIPQAEEVQKADRIAAPQIEAGSEPVPGLPDDMQMPEFDEELVRQAGRVAADVKSEKTEIGQWSKEELSQVELPDFVPMAAPGKGRKYTNVAYDVPIAEVDLGNGVFVVEEQEFGGTTDELLDLIDKVDEALDDPQVR